MVPAVRSLLPQLGIVVLAWVAICIQISWSPFARLSNPQPNLRGLRVRSR